MNIIKQTYIHPLIIIDSMIHITNTIRLNIDLLILLSICKKTINHSINNTHSIFTSNDKLLLMH